MKFNRYQQASRLFEEAMEIAPEQRGHFLNQATDGDDELLRRVARMVAYAERAEPTAGLQPSLGTRESNAAHLVGKNIGRYRVTELIGEGGFGAVYKAEQSVPVRRIVALKMVKAGMDSQQVIARFDAERQALAMMEHPGIARVIDAGQTEAVDGSRPYFVMEFVTGEAITDYCNRVRLNLDARLELFCQVCQAVQHAHQRGIIHRDLKPSNILVSESDNVATPKVIDFGIAKAIHQPLTDAMLVTNRMELLGTPQYMSPEQADANEQAIDTRTDVYSLGVVLYELLTGSPPLDEQSLRSASYTKLVQMIQEQRIDRPSLRVFGTSDRVQGFLGRLNVDAKAWSRRLCGELDWITLKALDPDRERRYDSAAALADDVRRFMRHEPVLAGPPSRLYRIRKFARRHRVGVTASVLLALTLIGGVIGTTIGMIHARDSAIEAREAADEALQINRFMRDVLVSADPERQGADVRLVDILRNATQTASTRFQAHPELEAQVHDMLGEVFNRLALWSQATDEFKMAQAKWESVYGPNDERALSSRVRYVQSVGNEGQWLQADALLATLPEEIELALGSDHDLWFNAQRLRSVQMAARGQFDEAESFLRDLLKRAESARIDDYTRVLVMAALVRTVERIVNKSSGTERLKANAKYEAAARDLTAQAIRTSGPTAVITLEAQLALATAISERGDHPAAAEVCRAILRSASARLGECHNLRVNAMGILSRALLWLDEGPEAAELELQCIKCKMDRAPIIVVSMLTDALPVLDRGGRWAEGEGYARQLTERLVAFDGGHGPMVLDAECYVAHFVSRQGRLDEADDQFTELFVHEDAARENGSVFARLHLFYGAHLVRRKQFEEAERHMKIAVDAVGDIHQGTWNWTPDDMILEFIALYREWDKPEKWAEYERLRAETLHRPAQSATSQTQG